MTLNNLNSKWSWKHAASLFTVVISLGALFSGVFDTRWDYVEYQLPQKNPTSFVFPFPVRQVHVAVDSSLRPDYHGWLKTSFDTLLYGRAAEVLKKQENKYDFYVGAAERQCDGYVYASRDKREKHILYSFGFHIHLSPKSTDSTSVEIHTLNPQIRVGIQFPFNCFNPPPPGATMYIAAPPSTIEEYMVLLEIGDKLCYRNKMPALVMPDSTRFITH